MPSKTSPSTRSVVPLAVKLLPESPLWLRANGRVEQARVVGVFSLVTLASLLTWYGLTTWLPQPMRVPSENEGVSPA